MRRRLLAIAASALVTAALAAASHAQLSPAGNGRVELMPGVTYEQLVELSPNGPLRVHVVRAPRPGGLYSLRPELSNDTVLGRERVTSIQRRLASQATMVGVNGDLFEWTTGKPSGVLVRDSVVISPPYGERSSVGVAVDGTLDVRRVKFFGAWRGVGQARVLHDLNEAPGPNETALFTSSYGAQTPQLPGAVAAVLFPFPAATPNMDLLAPVVDVRAAPSVAIPPGGAVLVARGTAVPALSNEALPGGELSVQLLFRPEWPGIAHAIGGGPVIVRDGSPVFRAGEAFLSSQLGPRNPRTAIGQRADGSLLLVVVDGRQPSLSAGVTNFELAQLLVRLGAVTASALDAGGSSTLAFDGRLLNSPSDPGGEREISTALMLAYSGVYAAPPLTSLVTPNGDGLDETPGLGFKVVRPSTVTASLIAPGGAVAWTETSERLPGAHPVAFPPGPPSPGPGPAPLQAGPALPEGRWTLRVEATDDLGQASAMRRTFVVNRTLGALRVTPRRLYVPPLGRDMAITWRLSRLARVAVTVETPAGEVVRTLATRRYPAGDQRVVWNGLDRERKAVKGGRYLVRVRAANALGRVELTAPVTTQRIAGPRK